MSLPLAGFGCFTGAMMVTHHLGASQLGLTG